MTIESLTLPTKESLRDFLKKKFGHDAFRAHQEQLIDAALQGKDAIGILPTGGGKSLCFQLPSLLHGGLTLVVSPLIALMKDQVDGLNANGLPATFINSSLKPEQIEKRMGDLSAGAVKILYVAPERLMMPSFLGKVKKWNVKLIAIDEAHCISEWGHDFRPEYRQLSTLRPQFPAIPMMALTATATPRVREDIAHQLDLKNPVICQASFNRPNLAYSVLPKQKGVKQLISFLKDHPNESGIIYCLSRKTCESLAKSLRKAGFGAKPYHAGLSSVARTKAQNEFLRDQTPIICATIAFGMGVHKSNARFVVHYNLPRNIESYYQETGRAGRDGLPSDCLLLYSAGDAGSLRRFIFDKPSEAERRRAFEQLDAIMAFAESAECRRKSLMTYFGEAWNQESCQGCDNCVRPRETFDATVPAQKLMSCVYRVRQKNGFQVGLSHIIDVLVGARTEKVERWGHDGLSTFGIGEEFKKSQWKRIGEELIRKNFLEQSADDYKTIGLSEKGVTALTQRTAITLTQPLASLKPQSIKKKDAPFDGALFEKLKNIRRALADQRDVPAYIIFSDASLREMARVKPKTMEEFGAISGVGEKKLDEFGPTFIHAIETGA